MSRFKALSKLLGITEEAVSKLSPEVISILKKVNTPEISTALKGEEKSKYLKALEEAYGDQSRRAKDLGFGNRDWYHGSTVDIPEFQKEALGLSTQANSAKKGFFFASDPSTASDYAELARHSGVNRDAIEVARASGARNAFMEQMQNKYGKRVLAFGDQTESPNWQNSMTPDEQKKFNDLENSYQTASETTTVPDLSDIELDLKEAKNNREFEISAFQRQLERNDNTKKVLGYRKADLKKNRIPEGLTKEDMQESIKKLEDSLAAGNKNVVDRQNKIREYENLIAKNEDVVRSQGQQVGAYRLKGNKDNLHVKDYEGQGYRDTSYSDEMHKAIQSKKEGVLFKNTFDPGNPDNRVEQDIAAVFEPNQIRSKFAAFDPRFKNSGNVLAGAAAIPAADMSLGSAIEGIQEHIAKPIASRWNDLKSTFTKPLANELDLTKDKAVSKDLKTGLDLALDPVNLLPGAAGVGAGALQLLGEDEEE